MLTNSTVMYQGVSRDITEKKLEMAIRGFNDITQRRYAPTNGTRAHAGDPRSVNSPVVSAEHSKHSPESAVIAADSKMIPLRNLGGSARVKGISYQGCHEG